MSERDDWPRRPLDAPADPDNEADAGSDGVAERTGSDWTTPAWPSSPEARSFERPEPRSSLEVEPRPTFGPPPGDDDGHDEDEEGFHHPLDRVTGGLPRTIRIVVDWVV